MKRSVTALHALDPNDGDAPRTVTESTYRRIRQDILWGHLAPGAPLRSDELRARYSVGISPLREALTRLSSERLVTAVGQRGFAVAPLTAEDVQDTAKTRIIIEREALTRSIQAGGIDWETAVVAAFHPLSRHVTPTKPGRETEIWARHHRQFHMALISACGSRWLIELAGLLFDQAERYRIIRAAAASVAKLKRDIGREHKQIFEAAIARDAKAAVQALERHYDSTAAQAVAALNARSRLRRSA